MKMFVVVQKRTLGTVAAILILAIVVGWAVRTEKQPSVDDAPGAAGGASLKEATPARKEPSGGLAEVVIPTVASAERPIEDDVPDEGRTLATHAERTAVDFATADIARGLESYYEARLARDRARSRRIELLTEVVLESDASEDRRRTSQQALDDILRRAEIEVVSEGIIRNQGFSHPLVFAGEESVSVVVSETLTQGGAARIGEAVARVAGVRRGSVVIVDGGNVATATQLP